MSKAKHENQAIQWLGCKQLFDCKTRYVVPIYQRNYEWGEPEITQLLTDIVEAYRRSPTQNYYLGSLVVYRRKDGSFEVIDGQQRLTTLNILYRCLEQAERNFQAQALKSQPNLN